MLVCAWSCAHTYVCTQQLQYTRGIYLHLICAQHADNSFIYLGLILLIWWYDRSQHTDVLGQSPGTIAYEQREMQIHSAWATVDLPTSLPPITGLALWFCTLICGWTSYMTSLMEYSRASAVLTRSSPCWVTDWYGTVSSHTEKKERIVAMAQSFAVWVACMQMRERVCIVVRYMFAVHCSLLYYGYIVVLTLLLLF